MAAMNRYCLKVAGLTVCLETEQIFPADEAFAPFLIPEGDCNCVARFRQAAELPPIPERVLLEGVCYRVHPDGKGGYIRSFFDAPRDMTPYAVAVCDHPRGEIRVDYLPKGAGCVSRWSNSFFHLDFESVLIHHRRLCFHAACVSTELGGILFSGPSGIGKSTQADLWRQHRGGMLINGDRPILSKSEYGWLAWGSPYAGSSRCYVNESCPVRAVVMLRQAGTCSLRRLGKAEAFRKIYAGLTLHSWDAGYMQTACDLTMELLEAVPVFELSCTPDEQAVICLERGLREEWNHEYPTENSPCAADGISLR